jgi:hypothetical protein
MSVIRMGKSLEQSSDVVVDGLGKRDLSRSFVCATLSYLGNSIADRMHTMTIADIF